MLRLYVIAYFLFLQSSAAWGFTYSGVAKTYSAFDDRLLGGDCQLREDPEAKDSSVWPVICVNLDAGSEFAFDQANSENNIGLNYGRIYSGLHISPLISLHGEGWRRRLYFLDDRIIKDESITQSMFVQLGNRTLTRFALAMGQFDMPFGTNHRFNMWLNDITLRNREYWRFPKFVTSLSFDNKVDSRIEVAVASSELNIINDKEERNERSENRVSRDDDQPLREALSIRASYDLSALEGTRIALSLYEEKNAPRRFGASIANRGANGSRSSLEWVRIGTLLRPDLDYSQLFRLTHATGFRAGSRTLFEFELDHKNYRILTIGYDKRLLREIVLRASFTYYWEDKVEDENRAIFGLGLRAAI